MNLQTAICNKVLEPKYLRVYMYIEELEKTNNINVRNAHKRDIVDIVSDIILVKEKYKIPFLEDLELLQKYNKYKSDIKCRINAKLINNAKCQSAPILGGHLVL